MDLGKKVWPPRCFRQTSLFFLSAAVQQQLHQLLGGGYDAWMSRMQSLLNQDGVEFLGSVSHKMLNLEFAGAGFM
jgi:hypothetical protein